MQPGVRLTKRKSEYVAKPKLLLRKQLSHGDIPEEIGDFRLPQIPDSKTPDEDDAVGRIISQAVVSKGLYTKLRRENFQRKKRDVRRQKYLTKVRVETPPRPKKIRKDRARGQKHLLFKAKDISQETTETEQSPESSPLDDQVEQHDEAREQSRTEIDNSEPLSNFERSINQNQSVLRSEYEQSQKMEKKASHAIHDTLSRVRQLLPLDLIYAHGKGKCASLAAQRAAELVESTIKRAYYGQLMVGLEAWKVRPKSFTRCSIV